MAGVRPDQLGHFTLHPKDPEAVRDFLIRVLDFRLTDIIAGDGYFCAAIRTTTDLVYSKGRGRFPTMPGRSRATPSSVVSRICSTSTDFGCCGDPSGTAQATTSRRIFLEPAGSVVEYYADMEQILDEATSEPRTWEIRLGGSRKGQ